MSKKSKKRKAQREAMARNKERVDRKNKKEVFYNGPEELPDYEIDEEDVAADEISDIDDDMSNELDGREILKNVNRVTYSANDSSLQTEITNLMHSIAMNSGIGTLSEMGYLHMSSLTFNSRTNAIHLRIYFDAKCATRVLDDGRVVPISELSVFSGYLFGGPIDRVCYIDKMLTPRYHREFDERGIERVIIDKGNKQEKNRVLIIEASLPIVLAAANDISLTDSAFAVSCTSFGKDGAKNSDMIITDGGNEIPLTVSVTYSDYGKNCHYDPDDLAAYFEMQANRAKSVNEESKRLKSKVSKKAEKAKKKSDSIQFQGFSKYC